MSEPARSEVAPVSHIDNARGRREKADWRHWGKTLREHYPMLGKPAIAIAMCLAAYADVDGYCYPKHGTLADETGYAPETIARGLRQLARSGVIRYEPGRGRRGSKYWLLPHARPDSQSGQTRSSDGSDAPPTHAQTRSSADSDPSSESAPLRSTSGGSTRGSIDPPASLPSELASQRTYEVVAGDEPPGPEGTTPADNERWLARLRHWAEIQRLPVEHLGAIGRATLMGRGTRAEIVAYLEQQTDWRDRPALASAPGPASEQLELKL